MRREVYPCQHSIASSYCCLYISTWQSYIVCLTELQESLANARQARDSRVCMKTCFCHLNVVWRPLTEERLAISTQSIHRWKVHLVGYNSVADNGSIFIRLAVIAFETREMSRNSKRIWPYSSSRSSKVIDIGVNGKPICDFILVLNSNFSHICYRFRDIHG